MDATIHVGRQLAWQANDTTPEEIDAQADRLREEGHVPIVRVTMTRSERRAINKAVRERDGRRCRKCGSRVDAQIVTMIYDERHNPERLVLLCRPCRRARPAEFGGVPGHGGWTPEWCWEWVLNGQSGLDERADRYLSDPRVIQALWAAGTQLPELREAVKRWLLESDFGLHPETDWGKRGPSPHAEAALREFFHGQAEPIPGAIAGLIASLDVSALPDVKEVMMSSTDPSAQPRKTDRTPSLNRSPKGQFDAQAALRALKAGDEEALVAVLTTTKWGKAGYQAQVTIEGALGPGTNELYDWASRLADCPEPAPRAIAAPLFRHYWPARPDEVQARLLQIADDEDWWVREAAHSAMGSLLVAHFEAFYPVLQAWAEHPSPNVRRGVALAARKAANERREEWADALLDLVEPLLADRAEYVRKNLGPYAIGDGLLRCHPQPTLARLRRWADDPREEVRWNVAMAFRSFGGTRHIEEALEVLERLAADERRFVWRAAASALHYLGRRQPEIVRPVVEGWLEDERRRRAAETALRYMANPPG